MPARSLDSLRRIKSVHYHESSSSDDELEYDAPESSRQQEREVRPAKTALQRRKQPKKVCFFDCTLLTIPST